MCSNSASDVDQSSGLTIGGFTASGSFGGNVGLGSLGNVDVSATASLSVTSATLSFVPGASGPEPDGKLRFADFQPNNIKNSIAGNVQGSVQLNPVTITADFLNLGDISWSANFSGTFNNTVWTQGTVNLNPPSVQTVLSDLAGGFFNLGGGFFSSSGGFPILGPLSNALNQQLPLIDESIAQLTGLDGDLPNLPTPGDLGLGSILSSLESIPGLQINDGDTSMDINDPNGLPAMVNKLINGQPTDIISWSASDDIQLADFSETIPILGIGIPDIASVELDATFGFSAELTYDVGLGIDSNGFYFKAGTPDDPTVSLEFEADAGIEGRLEVFGFSLADAGGDIGFEPKLYVDLTAPSYSANPGRVYMSDLATFGSNPFNDFLDALGGGIQGDLTGNLYAGINLLFFSISWNWGIEIPVFNYSLNPAWPPQASAGGGAAQQWLNVHLTSNPNVPGTSILEFDGTAQSDNVQLAGGSGGNVTINWKGHGSESFGPSAGQASVSEIVFHGDGGSDQLTTTPGFEIPVKADSGDGTNDKSLLQGGDGGGTLTGGAGSDTLLGGAGNDSITAGSGADTVIGGDGTDTLVGGNDPASTTLILSGSGNNSLVGGSGNDSIYAGTGNDVIHGGTGNFFIDGGTGTDTIDDVGGQGVIHAGAGNDTINCSQAGGPVQIFGDSGSDNITGSNFGDTIYGGSGGNNVIHGGGGDDLIFGGGNGDILCGDKGNDTIYAGPGNETLYGGDGQNSTETGWLTDPTHQQAGDSADAGSNLLIGGPASEAASGSTTLPVTFQLTGNTAIGSNTITALPSVSQLTVGQMVSGPGIPFGTTVSAIDSANSSVTISNNASAAGAGGTLFFTSPNQPTQLGTVAYNDVIYGDSTGRSTLRGGPGSDTLYAGLNGDYLAAGTGIDALIGGPGDDSLQLQWQSPQGTAQPLDKVVGGAGVDTLIIKGMPGGTINGAAFSGDNNIDLTQQPGTTNQYQATLTDLDVTNGPVIGQLDFTMPPDVEGIALEGGPENNQITVDPSVTTGVYVYGGPGNNTIYGGSGSDTLVGGLGSSVIYGGTGDSVLYGGDMPAQDNQHQPALDSAGTAISPPSGPAGTVVTITGTNLAGVTAVNFGSIAATITSDTATQITVTAPAQAADGDVQIEVTTTTAFATTTYDVGTFQYSSQALTSNRNTLIAGTGNDELYAGPGGDVLIGGSAIPQTILQNGQNVVQYVLKPGAGRDLLVGGSGGNPDLLIAGPGSPSAVMFAGNGSDTLVGDNSGSDVMAAGAGPATSSSAITGTITSRAAAATTHSWAGRALTISRPARATISSMPMATIIRSIRPRRRRRRPVLTWCCCRNPPMAPATRSRSSSR